MIKTLSVALAAATVYLSVFAASASALTYDVTSCQSTSGVLDSSNTWQYTGASGSPTALDVVDHCSPTGQSAFGATDTFGLGSTASGVFARWSFAAPSGTRITRLRIDRRIEVGAQSAWTVSGSTNLAPLPSEVCTGLTGSTDCVDDRAVDLGITGAVDSLDYVLKCDVAPGTCANGSFFHMTELRVRSATVTIADDVDPRLFTPTGALVENAFHRGNELVSFNADDVTGISERSVYVDGQQATAVALACEYSQPIPCGNPSRDVQIFVDTTTLADGGHNMQIAAKDAAGNETRSIAYPITVDNTAPSAPVLSVGARSTEDPGVSLSWGQPAETQVAPLSEARWRACPAGSATGCVAGSAPSGAANLALPSVGTWTVTVRLVDAAGNVGAPATATVRLAVAGSSGELGSPVLPVTPAVVVKPGARLKLGRAVLDRATRRLTVSGSLRRTINGHVRVAITRTVAKKTVRRSVSVKISRGRYRARIRITRAEASARKLVVEVSSPTDSRYRTDTVRRTVTAR